MYSFSGTIPIPMVSIFSVIEVIWRRKEALRNDVDSKMVERLESSVDNFSSSWLLAVRCSIVLGSCIFVERMPWHS